MIDSTRPLSPIHYADDFFKKDPEERKERATSQARRDKNILDKEFSIFEQNAFTTEIERSHAAINLKDLIPSLKYKDIERVKLEIEALRCEIQSCQKLSSEGGDKESYLIAKNLEKRDSTGNGAGFALKKIADCSPKIPDSIFFDFASGLGSHESQLIAIRPEMNLKLPKKIQRSYPPLADVDTVKWTRVNGQLITTSVHGRAESFEDHEILVVMTQAVEPPKIAKGSNGKSVIQQLATRGCTEACVAMFLADNGKEVDWHELMKCNLGKVDGMVRRLESAGLRAMTDTVQSLAELKRRIEMYGSAIVSVNTGYGAHMIIADSISEDLTTAVVRDPYHGWQITVKGRALQNACGSSTTIIQVCSKVLPKLSIY
jgi:hypothetical protein